MSYRHIVLEKIKEDRNKVFYKILTSDFNDKFEYEDFGYIEIDKIDKTYQHKNDNLWVKNKIYPIKLFELNPVEREKIVKEKYKSFGGGAWTISIFNFIKGCFLNSCYPDKQELIG